MDIKIRNHDDKQCLIVAAQANDLVVSRLIDGAMRAFFLSLINKNQVKLLRVKGALEIPLALKQASMSEQFFACVVLGAVIKGKTDHYDHVARMANDGVMSVALERNLSLGNGILSVHNLEQALERADGPCGNLGFDAANAALHLSAMFASIKESKPAQ